MSWSDARASLNSASVGTTNVNGTVIDLLTVTAYVTADIS